MREYRDYNTLVSSLDIQNGTITVTTASDRVDPSDGNITLREAIAYAGTEGLGMSIQFDIASTIALDGTELVIDKSLTIVGENSVRISGGQESRALSVSKDVSVMLSGLTIEEGKVAGKGGGIYNEGNLTLSECTVRDNFVSGVKEDNGYFEDGSHGGGIYNVGPLTVVNSTISGNSVYAHATNNNADSEGSNSYYSGHSTVNCTLPSDFSLLDIDITVAVLSPVMERLSKTGTLKLDASNSYGAAAYWWDLNSERTMS